MKLKKLIDKILKKDKKKVYLYYRDQLIYTKYLELSDDEKNILYIVKVRGKKHLFGTNRKVQLIMIPTRIKFIDNDKHVSHIEVTTFEGVDTE